MVMLSHELKKCKSAYYKVKKKDICNAVKGMKVIGFEYEGEIHFGKSITITLKNTEDTADTEGTVDTTDTMDTKINYIFDNCDSPGIKMTIPDLHFKQMITIRFQDILGAGSITRLDWVRDGYLYAMHKDNALTLKADCITSKKESDVDGKYGDNGWYKDKHRTKGNKEKKFVSINVNNLLKFDPLSVYLDSLVFYSDGVSVSRERINVISTIGDVKILSIDGMGDD